MLVSCLMPTADRRHLASLALRSFLQQDWPDKELIVIDDGKDPIRELVHAISNRVTVAYVYLAEPQRIGAKLNMACGEARGDVFVRFDDDDWSAPGRIADQVGRLDGHSVSGYHSMLFWDTVQRQASKYKGGSRYSLGSGLCFTREYWKAHPFPNSSVGEDNVFIGPAQESRQPGKGIVSVDANAMMVARIHGANSSNRTGTLRWPKVDSAEIPAAFFADLEAVHSAQAK